MSNSPRFSNVTLPTTLPIFPLSGTILFPQTRLPLNIFEPRYLSMVQDALADQNRMIGILQPTEAESPTVPIPALYHVGCVGRIISFNETDDGRLLIALGGLCRFAVTQEIETDTPYRRVAVDWTPYLHDIEDQDDEGIDRKKLVESVRRYLKNQDIAADWDAIESTPCDVLIASLIMICPLAPSEKQALLEIYHLPDRAKMLMTLLDMATLPQSTRDIIARH